MGEEISNTVNLDLNLGPDPEVTLEPATNNAAADLSDLANGPFNRDTESLRRFRTRHRLRFRQINILPALAETHNPAIELSQLMITSANGAALPAGEGSLAGGESVSKKCENGNKVMEEDDVTEEKRVVEKSVGSDGSFFDCYICLDLSKDPVVTSCGHLYCWSCLYRWLQVSEAKECPVCKGEVSLKTLTPIYGRGKENKRESQEVSDTKIPSRPQARRVESLRTTLHRSGYGATEMLRHLQDGLDRESSTEERPATPFLNRFMSSRGVRSEQNQSSAAPSDDTSNIDLISSIAHDNEEESGHLRDSSRAMSFRRQRQAQLAARQARWAAGMSFSPVLTSAERVRAEQNQSSATLVAPSDDTSNTELISSIAPDNEEESGHMRASSRAMSFRRQRQAQLAARQARWAAAMLISPVLTSAERLVDGYGMTHILRRNQEQSNIPSVGVEDRDSFSSIIGVINSESQVDNAAEIDSMVTVSTSSSVRRRPHENGSRVTDVDSADSRPPRRRRLPWNDF